MANLRNKAMLRKKGKYFYGEYTIYLVGPKKYKHLKIKQLIKNWKKEF